MQATMIKLAMTAKMVAAIARAKSLHPRVRLINAARRLYSVTGSRGDAYTVRFAVTSEGAKLAECTCKAGQSGQLCYHVAAAAQANVIAQSVRQQAAGYAQALTDYAAGKVGVGEVFEAAVRTGMKTIEAEPDIITIQEARAARNREREADIRARLNAVLIKPQPRGTLIDGWQV